jgi:hypothetical protein
MHNRMGPKSGHNRVDCSSRHDHPSRLHGTSLHMAPNVGPSAASGTQGPPSLGLSGPSLPSSNDRAPAQDARGELLRAPDEAQHDNEAFRAGLHRVQEDARREREALRAALLRTQADAQQEHEALRATLHRAREDAQRETETLRAALHRAQEDAQREGARRTDEQHAAAARVAHLEATIARAEAARAEAVLRAEDLTRRMPAPALNPTLALAPAHERAAATVTPQLVRYAYAHRIPAGAAVCVKCARAPQQIAAAPPQMSLCAVPDAQRPLLIGMSVDCVFFFFSVSPHYFRFPDESNCVTVLH